MSVVPNDMDAYIGMVSEAVVKAEESILEHYEMELPNECVGMIWADGSVQRLVNQARSPDRFSVSQTQMAERFAEKTEEDLLIGIYHSHPNGSPVLSPIDEKMFRAQFKKDLFIPWMIVTPWQLLYYWLDDDDRIQARVSSIGVRV